jgi:predicted nucleic acid-binding Zn ribbon protein
MRDLERAGAGLEKLVAHSLAQASPTASALLAWPVVCGSAVADRTRALDFQDGVLRVEVADAGWKSELQALAARYLAAINRYTREPVERIEFVMIRVTPESINSHSSIRS